MDEATARQKYQQHKHGAKARGIEFDLTFDEWRSIWGQHLANRGVHRGQMNMCRTRDEGGYTPGNVRIDTVESNHAEARWSKLRKDVARDWDFGGHNGADSRFGVIQRHIFSNPYEALREKEKAAMGLDDSEEDR